MDFRTRYAQLNDRQKQAVDLTEGPVMVIAGPGTGKTELLSMRAANILRVTDTLPENILCLTFTESGAAAMRERLVSIIGPSAYRIAIHTFHSFGSDIISQNGKFFYQGAHFRPSDDLHSYELLRSIFDTLAHNNPLASTMNGEYTHLHDTLSVISELKKSGLLYDELLQVLDANDRVLDIVEPLLAEVFAPRISKATIAAAQAVLDKLYASGGEVSITAIPPLSRLLGDSLTAAIEDASDSTKPLTQWKNHYLQKDEHGSLVVKARAHAAKLRAVSSIYQAYLHKMQEAELYDFDDMILRVVHAMEIFPELRYNLQERYQYIMVDEFQDTNLAQMRILHALTNNEATNGQPNLLVVGDDDQAIYSFQGADVGNISAFNHIYPAATLISLVDNYRSTNPILTAARSVITIDTDRLEDRTPHLSKQLTAHAAGNDDVALVECATIDDERQWLVDQIAAHVKAGVPPSSIAVLARRHHEIIALLPYFSQATIQVNYERQNNVLDLDIIVCIERIARITIALHTSQHDVASSLLPELLSHPAFAISPHDLWQLSLRAYSSHQSWLEVMATTPRFTDLHNWLITIAYDIDHTPLEHMLDHIVGHGEVLADTTFVSPLYDYFFSPEKLTSAPDDYLTHLEALRTIRSKLRDYRPDEEPTLHTFADFITLHRQRDSAITSARSASAHQPDAVHLMTAHKSKGREFDIVYVIGAIDSSWGEQVRSRSRLIRYPDNLPLAVSGDTWQERLRLFFVAMTRAKKHLTISYSRQDSAAKNTLRASFLSGDSWQPIVIPSDQSHAHRVKLAETAWYHPVISPLTSDLRTLLAPLLETYKLSATHLGNFVDVTRGGPHGFLVNNLLRFPQAMSPSAAYGSAIHAALQRAHAHLAATGVRRPVEDVLHDYEENLSDRHLSTADYTLFLQKGSDTLSAFLAHHYDSFTPAQKVELNFAGQQVFVGDAHLTGSLDLVEMHDHSAIVTDYKTGHPSTSWTGKTDYEKIKLHRYKQQLMFYQLLMNHSRDYHTYTIDQHIIQFVEPTQRGDIIALHADFTTDEYERFTRLVAAVWKHIRALDLPDTSSYEQNYRGIVAFEAALIDEIV